MYLPIFGPICLVHKSFPALAKPVTLFPNHSLERGGIERALGRFPLATPERTRERPPRRSGSPSSGASREPFPRPASVLCPRALPRRHHRGHRASHHFSQRTRHRSHRRRDSRSLGAAHLDLHGRGPRKHHRLKRPIPVLAADSRNLHPRGVGARLRQKHADQHGPARQPARHRKCRAATGRGRRASHGERVRAGAAQHHRRHHRQRLRQPAGGQLAAGAAQRPRSAQPPARRHLHGPLRCRGRHARHGQHLHRFARRLGQRRAQRSIQHHSRWRRRQRH